VTSLLCPVIVDIMGIYYGIYPVTSILYIKYRSWVSTKGIGREVAFRVWLYAELQCNNFGMLYVLSCDQMPKSWFEMPRSDTTLFVSCGASTSVMPAQMVSSAVKLWVSLVCVCAIDGVAHVAYRGARARLHSLDRSSVGAYATLP
jgi:hypothetical protein